MPVVTQPNATIKGTFLWFNVTPVKSFGDFPGDGQIDGQIEVFDMFSPVLGPVAAIAIVWNHKYSSDKDSNTFDVTGGITEGPCQSQLKDRVRDICAGSA